MLKTSSELNLQVYLEYGCKYELLVTYISLLKMIWELHKRSHGRQTNTHQNTGNKLFNSSDFREQREEGWYQWRFCLFWMQTPDWVGREPSKASCFLKAAIFALWDFQD